MEKQTALVISWASPPVSDEIDAGGIHSFFLGHQTDSATTHNRTKGTTTTTRPVVTYWQLAQEQRVLTRWSRRPGHTRTLSRTSRSIGRRRANSWDMWLVGFPEETSRTYAAAVQRSVHASRVAATGPSSSCLFSSLARSPVGHSWTC